MRPTNVPINTAPKVLSKAGIFGSRSNGFTAVAVPFPVVAILSVSSGEHYGTGDFGTGGAGGKNRGVQAPMSEIKHTLLYGRDEGETGAILTGTAYHNRHPPAWGTPG